MTACYWCTVMQSASSNEHRHLFRRLVKFEDHNDSPKAGHVIQTDTSAEAWNLYCSGLRTSVWTRAPVAMENFSRLMQMRSVTRACRGIVQLDCCMHGQGSRLRLADSRDTHGLSYLPADSLAGGG